MRKVNFLSYPRTQSRWDSLALTLTTFLSPVLGAIRNLPPAPRGAGNRGTFPLRAGCIEALWKNISSPLWKLFHKPENRRP